MSSQNEKPSIEYQPEASGNSGVLYLRGDLGIQQSKSVKEALIEALNRGDTLRLNVKELLSIDLMITQSLFAAHQFAKKNNIKMELDGTCPQVLFDAVHTVGLHSHAWLCFG